MLIWSEVYCGVECIMTSGPKSINKYICTCTRKVSKNELDRDRKIRPRWKPGIRTVLIKRQQHYWTGKGEVWLWCLWRPRRPHNWWATFGAADVSCRLDVLSEGDSYHPPNSHLAWKLTQLAIASHFSRETQNPHFKYESSWFLNVATNSIKSNYWLIFTNRICTLNQSAGHSCNLEADASSYNCPQDKWWHLGHYLTSVLNL